MKEYKNKYEEWINNPYFDNNTKEELQKIVDKKEIQDRFYKDLEFGTGGLRGILGAGTNRMNIYTVRKATQGLANYINKNINKENQNININHLEDSNIKTSMPSVVIAYDSRNRSKEFAMETALCFNANGIITYLFDSLRPTPELSFGVRYLKCTAGVVITASHNPAEYNGYKVYWSDGGQITTPLDKEIITEVNKVKNYSVVKTMEKSHAERKNLHHIIGKEIDDEYIKELKKQILNLESIKKQADKIKIVYTPLHGTGNVLIRRLLKELGFHNVFVVKEQELPDGDFPTVKSPNPENKEAFELALKLAKDKEADLVLATDPDADRLGIYVLDKNSKEYKPFTGNMTGALLTEYILHTRKLNKKYSTQDTVIKTIVSTNLVDKIAKNYKVNLLQVLTGFKYIGEKIKLFEETNKYNYVFGMEESYGCLLGTYARDKDAIVATMALCEAASYYMEQGKTLWDVMLSLYEKYGYFIETQKSIILKGEEGSLKIKQLIEDIRNNPKKQISKLKVLKIRDYKKGYVLEVETGHVAELNAPISNVIYYELEHNSWLAIRPSGTEPKIKIYVGVCADNFEIANRMQQDIIQEIFQEVNDL